MSVLTPSDLTTLSRSSRRTLVSVRAHERQSRWYRGSVARRLAAWRRLELAAIALCRSVDHSGRIAGDTERLRRLMALLDDSLGR